MPVMPSPDDLPSIPYAEGGAWHKLYPLLVAYMTDSTWPNGTTRKPSRVFCSPENGAWKWTLKEPNMGLVLSATVQVPEEGLPALEAMLALPKPPWMADPWENGKGKKKSK